MDDGGGPKTVGPQGHRASGPGEVSVLCLDKRMPRHAYGGTLIGCQFSGNSGFPAGTSGEIGRSEGERLPEPPMHSLVAEESHG